MSAEKRLRQEGGPVSDDDAMARMIIEARRQQKAARRRARRRGLFLLLVAQCILLVIGGISVFRSPPDLLLALIAVPCFCAVLMLMMREVLAVREGDREDEVITFVNRCRVTGSDLVSADGWEDDLSEAVAIVLSGAEETVARACGIDQEGLIALEIVVSVQVTERVGETIIQFYPSDLVEIASDESEDDDGEGADFENFDAYGSWIDGLQDEDEDDEDRVS